MPSKLTVEKAKRDLQEGKSPTTGAGEFVHEEIEHVRHGKHGARSPQQAIAIGLSKARRAGIPLKPPRRGTVKETTRRSAERAYRKGQSHAKPPRRKYSRVRENTMKREPRSSVSHRALSRQARGAAARRRRRTHSRTAGRRHRTRT
ncbi:MAG: transcription elongation factor [Candidatus Acidiferrales bacterium]